MFILHPRCLIVGLFKVIWHLTEGKKKKIKNLWLIFDLIIICLAKLSETWKSWLLGEGLETVNSLFSSFTMIKNVGKPQGNLSITFKQQEQQNKYVYLFNLQTEATFKKWYINAVIWFHPKRCTSQWQFVFLLRLGIAPWWTLWGRWAPWYCWYLFQRWYFSSLSVGEVSLLSDSPLRDK